MGTDLRAPVTEVVYSQELHGVVPDTEGTHETHEPGEMTGLGDHHRRRLLLGASADWKIGRRSLSRLPALGSLSLAPQAFIPAVLWCSVGQALVGSQGGPVQAPDGRIPGPHGRLDSVSTLIDPKRATRRQSRFSATDWTPDSPIRLTENGGLADRRHRSPTVQ